MNNKSSEEERQREKKHLSVGLNKKKKTITGIERKNESSSKSCDIDYKVSGSKKHNGIPND